MSILVSWGAAQHGQLGQRAVDDANIFTPTPLEALKGEDIDNVACGEHHTLVLLKNGQVFSCGKNEYGQLGRHGSHSKPEQVLALSKQLGCQIAAGSDHSLVLTQAGEVFSFGKNSNGQLGRGDIEDEELRTTPKLLKPLVPHTVIQISCGRLHCIALTDASAVCVWGDNTFGQLGLGTSTKSYNQAQILTCLRGIPVAQVVAGGSHSFILSQSGAVFGWGRNCFGQLGVNDDKDRLVPTLCKPLRYQNVKYISCGEDHSAVLTQGGGVFTFGSGTYGQLGHNSKHNEILPRKVEELMGSNVTQITSGRRHTLAYVTESGRLYSFGSNACGQLGVKDGSIKTTPTFVKDVFTPFQSSPMQVDNDSNLVVRRVAAGGDHCVVIATSLSSCQRPDDFRKMPWKQVTCLTGDKIDRICSLKADESIPVDFEEDIIRIFSTASCLNCSFLISNDGHYGSNSKRHGVNMELVRKIFTKLGEDATNIVMMQKISHSIEGTLLPGLPTSPPDVEALRLYLILPEMPMFDQPKRYSSLMSPFGHCITQLDKPASRVLDLWWGSLAVPYFRRLVYIYKETVIYVLQLPDNPALQERQSRYKALYYSLEVLKKLNNVNEQHGQIIAYNKFYIPELKDRVNIKGDYVTWVQQQGISRAPFQQQLLFCNYPFTFDAAAKSVLLQTDALMQMQTAIDEVQRRNLQSLFLPIDPVNPCLVFYVSRNNIVHDTLRQLAQRSSADLKKPLKISFVGEEAIDDGGVRKEFFLLLLREVLDPKYGMFQYYEESRLIWFSTMTFETKEMYLLIGCLCGLAIYNSTIIQLNFPLALYKKLLKRQPILDDLKELMPSVGRSFEHLLEYDGDDFEDTFALTFEVSRDCFGEMKTDELVPGGSKRAVTKDNRKEYVDLYIDHVFNKSTEEQFDAFDQGFHKVCGGRVLELFHPQELMAMVIGNENYDFLEFENNTEYKGEYHRYHQTIKFFWDVFHDLSMEEKKKFLLYLTGSDKIPIVGMKYVKMVIQPMNVVEKYLPVAHTCFNLLDLPKYTDKATLKTKLLQAIDQNEGFGLV